MPALAAAIAIFMELPVAFAVAVGAFTRPSAVLMALYTLGTSLVEHRYWTVKGADRVDSLESFYKNLSIMGGFLLLYVTGPGKYSADVCSASPCPEPCAVGTKVQGPVRWRLKPLGARSLCGASQRRARKGLAERPEEIGCGALAQNASRLSPGAKPDGVGSIASATARRIQIDPVQRHQGRWP